MVSDFERVGTEMITFQSIPEVIPIGIAAVLSSALAVFAWRRRAMPMAPAFATMMAGGGSRPGAIHGETDEFSYNIVKDPVHIHDFHATVLQLLGFDHRRFSVRYQGLDQRLTGVEPARVIKDLLA
jgi:hypothetical protein